MSEWPEYVSHKQVQAAEIVGRREQNVWVVDSGSGPENFSATVREMSDKAQIGDFAVVYTDGFKSICPRKQFLEGYERL